MPFFGHSPVDFRDRPLLFIDLEMTGLDIHRHEIVEVAALLVTQNDWQIKNSYYTKVIADHIETADPDAMKIINYTSEGWKEAIPLRQMLTELSEFAPNCMLAGWSVQNEWDFLSIALEREKLPFFYYNYLLEVSTLAFIKLRSDPRLTRLGLTSVAKYLKVPLDQHKPDSDIRATYEIFRRLIAQT